MNLTLKQLKEKILEAETKGAGEDTTLTMFVENEEIDYIIKDAVYQEKYNNFRIIS